MRDLESDTQAAESATRTIPLLPAIVLVLASAILAAAVTYFVVSRDDEPGAADIGFYDDMSTHHFQAVEMARVYERDGDDDVMRSIAQEIEASQIGDIRLMQVALADWDEIGTPNIAMEWMGMRVPQNLQPGMVTAARMTELEAARGSELDDLFTRLMIDHHAAGVHMAEEAKDRAQLAKVREFAGAMAFTQSREIDELNNRRRALGLAAYEPE